MVVYKNKVRHHMMAFQHYCEHLNVQVNHLKKKLLLYKKKIILEIIKQKNRELLLIFP